MVISVAEAEMRFRRGLRPSKLTAVFRLRPGPDLERELNETDSATSRLTNRFLDRLGFPP